MTNSQIIPFDVFAGDLESGRFAEIWNVLTDDYFTGEMIPGSRRVPLDQVGREAAGLAKDTTIAVYCSGPSCPQSKAAGEKLAALGFEDVRVFEGGLEAWKSADRTVETAGATSAI